jgi:hypothetical protein
MLVSPLGINPPTFTWATKPAATAFTGFARISDLGLKGIFAYSDGTQWSVQQYNLLVGGLPVFLPSSGSIANNGALTLTTTLIATFTSCYMYFPANAIVAGGAAGIYYVVMSSGTAGTIYNNTYTTGIPSIPASPTAFATVGPGAYTQTTGADITLLSASIHGGVLGLSGGVEPRVLWRFPNNANNKLIKFLFGGQQLVSATYTTTNAADLMKSVFNSGVENVQMSHNSPVIGAATITGQTALAVNTANAVTVAATGQIAVDTDFVGVLQYLVRVIPS